MAKQKVNQDALIDEAWGLIDEAIHKGQVKLRDREAAMALQPEHIVRLLQWLAHQKQKKPKLTSTLEDFLVQEGDDGPGS